MGWQGGDPPHTPFHLKKREKETGEGRREKREKEVNNRKKGGKNEINQNDHNAVYKWVKTNEFLTG